MISANGGLPAHRYTPQVTPRWPRGSEPGEQPPPVPGGTTRAPPGPTDASRVAPLAPRRGPIPQTAALPPPPHPARRSRLRLSRSRQRHRASPAHSHRSCSPWRRHDSPGLRHCRSRSPGRHRARHRRPMFASFSPYERHRASSPPRHRYASSTPSPRHCRSRTLSSKPSPPRAPAHLAWWSASALRELRR